MTDTHFDRAEKAGAHTPEGLSAAILDLPFLDAALLISGSPRGMNKIGYMAN